MLNTGAVMGQMSQMQLLWAARVCKQVICSSKQQGMHS